MCVVCAVCAVWCVWGGVGGGGGVSMVGGVVCVSWIHSAVQALSLIWWCLRAFSYIEVLLD